MENNQHERYVRWQEHRLNQLTFSINLFLGFAVASLAFAINIKIGKSLQVFIPLNCIIIWWSVSAASGCIATISRLLDFRFTARKIKNSSDKDKCVAKLCGYITWGFFWIQVITYVIGAIKFINGVIVI